MCVYMMMYVVLCNIYRIFYFAICVTYKKKKESEKECESCIFRTDFFIWHLVGRNT